MGHTNIFIVSHKEIHFAEVPGYSVLQVGTEKNGRLLGANFFDNTGDHISALNDAYCELTGLYWIWKNNTDTVVGLVHYRRFFAKLKPHIDFLGRHFVIGGKPFFSLLSTHKALDMLRDVDMVVKKSEFRLRNVRAIFINQLGEKTFGKIGQTIAKICPEYLAEYEKICTAHSHINCNMFIGKKEVVDAYCSWLFSVLFAMDAEQTRETGERYRNRELGYVSELLFGVWLGHNKIRYRSFSVVFTEDPLVVNGVMPLTAFGWFIYKKMKSFFLA